MAKWVLLAFVIALACSGWWASRDGAPGWARISPMLVLAAGVTTGLVYAIAHGRRRRKDIEQVASRLGLRFRASWPREKLRELGLGTLKLFAHCRPHDQLPLVQRTVRVHFYNVMHGDDPTTELIAFDYTTSNGSDAPNLRGTFACFRTPGTMLPHAEIRPRLWGEPPKWLAALTDVPPAMMELDLGDERLAAEYALFAADESDGRSVLTRDLVRLLSDDRETGWRLATGGEWMAVTRLAPAKKVGSLDDPMLPDAVPREQRCGYFEYPIEPARIPDFIERARRIHASVCGSLRSGR